MSRMAKLTPAKYVEIPLRSRRRRKVIHAMIARIKPTRSETANTSPVSVSLGHDKYKPRWFKKMGPGSSRLSFAAGNLLKIAKYQTNRSTSRGMFR